MARHSDSIRLLLAKGPMLARQVVENTGLSQPTVSRALAVLVYSRRKKLKTLAI